MGDIGKGRHRGPVRRPARDLRLIDQDPAACGRQHAHEAFQQGGFAGTVATKHGHALARRDLESNAAQHLRAAIMLIQPFDAESHGQRPKYTSTTRPSARAFAMEPSNKVLPSWSTVTRSAIRST